jgi:hypothetical protein
MKKTLRRVFGISLVFLVIAACGIQVCALKNSPPPDAAPLVLTGVILSPNVKGRIDHFRSICVRQDRWSAAIRSKSGSDLGLVSGVKQFLRGSKNGLSVPSKSNKLHVVVALSRHFRAVSDTAGKWGERKGTVRQKQSNICGGVVQLVRTPAYSKLLQIGDS